MTARKSGFGRICRVAGSRCISGTLLAPSGCPFSNSGTDLTSMYEYPSSVWRRRASRTPTVVMLIAAPSSDGPAVNLNR